MSNEQIVTITTEAHGSRDLIMLRQYMIRRSSHQRPVRYVIEKIEAFGKRTVWVTGHTVRRMHDHPGSVIYGRTRSFSTELPLISYIEDEDQI